MILVYLNLFAVAFSYLQISNAFVVRSSRNVRMKVKPIVVQPTITAADTLLLSNRKLSHEKKLHSIVSDEVCYYENLS